MIATAATSDRAETGYHEASHAIACVVVGARLHDTRIIAGADRSGETRLCDSLASVEQSIAIYLAGPMGGWIARGRIGIPLDYHARLDLTFVDNALTEHYGRRVARESSAEYKNGYKLAEKIVREYWPAITHLASWLAQHDYARGDFVRAIVSNYQSKIEAA